MMESFSYLSLTDEGLILSILKWVFNRLGFFPHGFPLYWNSNNELYLPCKEMKSLMSCFQLSRAVFCWTLHSVRVSQGGLQSPYLDLGLFSFWAILAWFPAAQTALDAVIWHLYTRKSVVFCLNSRCPCTSCRHKDILSGRKVLEEHSLQVDCPCSRVKSSPVDCSFL